MCGGPYDVEIGRLGGKPTLVCRLRAEVHPKLPCLRSDCYNEIAAIAQQRPGLTRKAEDVLGRSMVEMKGHVRVRVLGEGDDMIGCRVVSCS